MATIYRGTPRKIRGGWGAGVPAEAQPGDYVEVTTKGGHTWVAEITKVNRNRAGAVAETKQLPPEEQEATLANVPFAGSEPTGARPDASTPGKSTDGPATDS